MTGAEEVDAHEYPAGHCVHAVIPVVAYHPIPQAEKTPVVEQDCPFGHVVHTV